MSRVRKSPPSYRRHRPTGQAVVTLSDTTIIWVATALAPAVTSMIG